MKKRWKSIIAIIMAVLIVLQFNGSFRDAFLLATGTPDAVEEQTQEEQTQEEESEEEAKEEPEEEEPAEEKNDVENIVLPDSEKQASEQEEKPESEEEQNEAAPDVSEALLLEDTVELTQKGENCEVSVTLTPETKLPADTELGLTEIGKKSEDYDYDALYQKTLSAVQKDAGKDTVIDTVYFYDFTLTSGEETVIPETPVNLTISYDKGIEVNDAESVRIVSLDVNDNGKVNETELLDPDKVEVNTEKAGSSQEELKEAGFETDTKTVYAVVHTMSATVLTESGETYEIKVKYDDKAGVPEGSELKVREITETSGSYAGYVNRAENTLGYSAGDVSYVRLFDISIHDKSGEKVTIAAPVDVTIRLMDDDIRASKADVQVVHFEDSGHPDVVDSTLASHKKDKEVSFAAEGFSVYAIVEAPEPAKTEITEMENLQDLNTEEGFCLSLVRGGTTQYMGSGLNSGNCFIESSDINNAATWYFENVEGKEGQYYIYTSIGDEKRYIRQASSNGGKNVRLDASGSPFVLSQGPGNKVYIRLASAELWLQHSKSGGGIRFWNDILNAENSQFVLTYASSLQIEKDPYDLDGKTYGIAYYDEKITSAALTATEQEVNGAHRLAGKDLLMRPDVTDQSGYLLVSKNSDIQEWTFHSVEADRYNITTKIGGATKYLAIRGKNIVLADEPDAEGTQISAVPGTDDHSGKWHLKVDGVSLGLPGGADGGFAGLSGDDNNTWMSLVERSSRLGDDDFIKYTARKVSVSDTKNVADGKQVMLYTRLWNDTTKRYEFYAVNSDGTLIRCYDAGDSIEWIGYKVNTALWNFTEYKEEDGSPNYYYELMSVQPQQKYLAPQVSGNQVLSDDKVGINLNGRRYGENYTTIITWDPESYSYAGLKTEKGKIRSCPLAEAEDFYFAILDPVEEDNSPLTTVKTIDSDQYGISMKMVNFNELNGKKERERNQEAFFKGDNNRAGLLTNDLKSNGYPDATSAAGKPGHSLSELFKGMTDVNHLFIQSIYNESGYFEYDSTQNFAHLNDNGTFTVYDQLGAISGNGQTKNTRVHGQFMPYNDLTQGKLMPDGITNQTDVYGSELPDTDPRKGEKLYDIGSNVNNGEADYFFGMEMEASFTQTANGLDAWGHDIIFEFSGDDDFWFYVDGELVLDLGGVHSAMTGSVNFRTGEIKSSRGNFTLYQIFKDHYKERGLSESEVDKLFEKKGNNYVFRDYTNHTMKIFYMERGAGASNLHMRFNLAAVKPDSFILSKELEGTEESENDLIEFPYQISYYSKSDGGDTPHLLGENSGDRDLVLYEGTSTPVRYQSKFTPFGGSSSYDHVFFLKAGQSAEVTLPEDTIRYYVTECGINPDVFSKVKVNGEELKGVPTGNKSGNTHRCDYSTDAKTTEERSRVDYSNRVSDGAMRTLNITKHLYDADGKTRLHSDTKDKDKLDETPFQFRLYLGSENENPADLPLANIYPYLVKDGDGHYCKWDSKKKRFTPILRDGSNITDYSDLKQYLKGLSEAEKDSIVFKTSMNGSITQIPADHSVEVRSLIVGTRFKVEERDSEIPRGYTLRLSDGYQRTDTNGNTGTEPITGTVEPESDPKILVSNQKGWGLTVKKQWTDSDFMESHDPVYFAVYSKEKGDEGSWPLLEGSVRCLSPGQTSLYYFFDKLQSGTPFDNYVIREVKLEGEFAVDAKGIVSGYTGVTPIGEGERTEIGGKPVGGKEQSNEYTVTYLPGEITDRNENVRTDTVINSRPGIQIRKTDWDGSPLPGAVFTLKESNGQDVAAETYTSDKTGLVTIAYLSSGTYTLAETESPKGFEAIEPIQITVDNDDKVAVTGGNEESYVFTEADGDNTMAELTVRDRSSSLQVKKVDSITKETLPGVEFKLYPQVTDVHGNVQMDLNPLKIMSTDNHGMLSGFDFSQELPAGTYYLQETPPEGYAGIPEPICFTIGKDRVVTINNEAYSSWISSEKDQTTHITTYTICVPNTKAERVSLWKTDMDHTTITTGATFVLYRAEDYDDKAGSPKSEATPLLTGTTDERGLLNLGELPLGQYRLEETEAPDGFSPASSYISITVDSRGSEGYSVTAMQADSVSEVYRQGSEYWVEGQHQGTWQVRIWNNPNVILPSTGGSGTGLFHKMGLLMIGLCGVTYTGMRRRRGQLF